MSIQNEINRISGNIAGAYAAVAEKGGSLPERLTSDSLAEAIRSIPSGGNDSASEIPVIKNQRITNIETFTHIGNYYSVNVINCSISLKDAADDYCIVSFENELIYVNMLKQYVEDVPEPEWPVEGVIIVDMTGSAWSLDIDDEGNFTDCEFLDLNSNPQSYGSSAIIMGDKEPLVNDFAPISEADIFGRALEVDSYLVATYVYIKNNYSSNGSNDYWDCKIYMVAGIIKEHEFTDELSGSTWTQLALSIGSVFNPNNGNQRLTVYNSSQEPVLDSDFDILTDEFEELPGLGQRVYVLYSWQTTSGNALYYVWCDVVGFAHLPDDENALEATLRIVNRRVLFDGRAYCAKEVYSTDETIIGTWIDGRTLYRRVIKYHTPSKMNAADFVYDVDGYLLGAIDTLIEKKLLVRGIVYDNEGMPRDGGYVVPNIMMSSDGRARVYPVLTVDLGERSIGVGIYGTETKSDYLDREAVVILEYTKTTDESETISTQALSQPTVQKGE